MLSCAVRSQHRLEGTANYFHSMSLFQQVKPAEARDNFTATETKMKPLPTADQKARAADEHHDDPILWLAVKEAKALLQIPATAAKPRHLAKHFFSVCP